MKLDIGVWWVMVAVLWMALASSAQAAAVDVTAVTETITDNLVPIAAVGGIGLLIVVTLVAVKWVKGLLGFAQYNR